MKPFLFVLTFLLVSFSVYSQQTTYSRQALINDLDYLEQALKETHPGLYRYQTAAQFDSALAATRAGVTDRMSHRAFYALLTRLVAGIRCAHTVAEPRRNWLDTLRTAGFFFPFQIYFLEGEPYLVMNRTTSTAVPTDSRLLTINGRPVKDIVQEMFRHISADGYNETLKYRQIFDYMFSFYYNALIAQTDTFHITYADRSGQEHSATVNAVTVAEAGRNGRQNPLNKPLFQGARKEFKATKGLRRYISINRKTGVATLVLKDYFGGKTAAEADVKLRAFMDDCMQKIAAAKVTHLVIDLRLNAGGYDSQGFELLGYFIDKPVRYYESLHMITNNSPFLRYSSIPQEQIKNEAPKLQRQPDGTYLLHESVMRTLGYVQPKPNAFRGKVYFLADGGTGSAAAEFTAVAHSLGLGTFIGEETGGNYTGGNGAEFIGLELPATKMRVNIPLMYYRNAVKEPVEKGRGTMPHYAVSYTVHDLVTVKDTQLEFVYRLIADEKKK